MRFPRRHILALVAAALAACGPSKSEIREARHAVYQTDFATVWNAVATTVKEQYPRMAIEDPVKGKLLTDWHLVERVDFEEGAQAPNNTGGTPSPMEQQSRMGGRFFRIAVVIKPGGPPWRLVIDGEAALYRPGMAMITPYEHDDADEPPWVRPRIEKVRVGIHRKLKKFAREVVIVEKPKRGPDTTAWANLPEAAALAVAQVHAAADKKDLEALRATMLDDFLWSLGADEGADAAISFWSADPHVLARLRDTLAAGCELRDAQALVVCPVTADQPGSWRAEFRQDGAGQWRFAAFYVNE